MCALTLLRAGVKACSCLCASVFVRAGACVCLWAVGLFVGAAPIDKAADRPLGSQSSADDSVSVRVCVCVLWHARAGGCVCGLGGGGVCCFGILDDILGKT